MVSAIVIDGDRDVLESFCEILSKRGLKIVATGSNGFEAVELYKKNKPDMVFLDLEIPVKDGFFALREIKKMDPTSKVIVTTCSTESNFERILLENGAEKVVIKPVNTNRISREFNNCSLN